MSIMQSNYGTMYYVTDMKKTVDYYKSMFGLNARYESNEWTEFMLGDNTALCLHSTTDAKMTGVGYLITNVKNIKTLVPELKQKGVEFIDEIKEVHPGAFSVHFKDPAGNVISLFEDTNSR